MNEPGQRAQLEDLREQVQQLRERVAGQEAALDGYRRLVAEACLESVAEGGISRVALTVVPMAMPVLVPFPDCERRRLGMLAAIAGLDWFRPRDIGANDRDLARRDDLKALFRAGLVERRDRIGHDSKRRYQLYDYRISAAGRARLAQVSELGKTPAPAAAADGPNGNGRHP